MKKLLAMSSVILLSTGLISQTDHTIVTEGLSYSPSELNVSVGDMVTFEISSVHPTTQVSEDTWNANGTTDLAGGFGTNTSTFSIEITEPGIIYYVCDNHVSSGMKGLINASAVGVEEFSENFEVSFGRMPIQDGVLKYRIESTMNTVGHLEVISLGGIQVGSAAIESAEGQIQLNVTPGVYVVVIRSDISQVLFKQTISVE